MAEDLEAAGRPRRHQHRLTEAEEVAIALAYRGGATMNELAATYSVHRTTIRACLSRLAIPLRDRSLSVDDQSAIIDLYQAGWSLLRLAEKFACDVETVRRVLVKAGVPRRKPWQRD